MREAIIIRDLKTAAELHACVALQRETWGESFNEVVPPAILQVSQYIGGVSAGAFLPNDEMIGFVFGLTGIENTATGSVVGVHWSDMLAVKQEYRNRGIGERLKRYQRDALLKRNVQRVYWTFDPLDAKNAYVNFCRLGIIAREYRVDMYGEQTDSPLHQGIGTDRLIAVWPIASRRVSERLEGIRKPPKNIAQRIDVPLDIHDIKAREPDVARQWRERTRAAFREHLDDGYVVVDFVREATRGSYLLASPSDLEI
ncbi:MAG TPA: GNAT family N-acetyltransferase [Longimicrobiales bacterium]